jgi:hypothetical protein
MGRNQLAHRSGDAINALLAAVGYSFRRLLKWMRLLFAAVAIAPTTELRLRYARNRKFHGRPNSPAAAEGGDPPRKPANLDNPGANAPV